MCSLRALYPGPVVGVDSLLTFGLTCWMCFYLLSTVLASHYWSRSIQHFIVTNHPNILSQQQQQPLAATNQQQQQHCVLRCVASHLSPLLWMTGVAIAVFGVAASIALCLPLTLQQQQLSQDSNTTITVTAASRQIM